MLNSTQLSLNPNFLHIECKPKIYNDKLACLNWKLSINTSFIFPNVQTLVLSRNKIKDWPGAILKSLPNLSCLKLDNNPLGQVKQI